MVRAPRAISRVELTWRLLTPLLAMALVLTAGMLTPEPMEASGSSIVAAYRGKQITAEADMRRADRQLVQLQKQRRNHAKLLGTAKKKLASAIKRRKAAERKADKVDNRLSDLKLSLARKTLVRPNPAGTQKIDKPKLRKRIKRLKQQVRKLETKARQAEKKEVKVRKLKQSRVSRPTQARMAARRSERERSEDRLGSAIYAMTELSKDRAGRFGTSSVRGFGKPTAGNISQPFGCTGLATNPRRGACRHFHDGVDIAASTGARVKASADGYVAYVGYSPWDDGKRAFVVIIGHAGGYESVYAHLQPKRLVRAGQKVRRGQAIGRIGMTGLTTGPHVHWELRKGGVNVNPLGGGR